MSGDGVVHEKAAQLEAQRSLTTDIALAVSGGAAGGAANAAVGAAVSHILNRPPKEEAPKVVLPPGVSEE
jgi:hypothetical protein